MRGSLAKILHYSQQLAAMNPLVQGKCLGFQCKQVKQNTLVFINFKANGEKKSKVQHV